MYHVYILKSRKNGKQYTGYTQKLPAVRLKEHNQGSNDWTRHNGPFDLLYSECYASRKAAVNRERYMKSAAGRLFLKGKLSGAIA